MRGNVMKPTGIVRNIDELGRIVVPKEMRKALDITDNDPVEIAMEGDRIVLRKKVASCVFCGSEGEYVVFKSKRVCKSCLEEIAK